MTRPAKIALIVAGSIAGLVIALFIVGIIVVQTPWFREQVRSKIIAEIEDATGGRATIGSFAWNARHLRATMRDVAVHGLEPAGAAPLLHANTVVLDLRPASPSHGYVGISSLAIDSPSVNVIIYPDGHTNVPSPKVKSNKTVLQSLVNLAVGRFDIRNGTFTVGDRKAAFSAAGENLRAHFDYYPLLPRYSGELAADPVLLQSGSEPPVRAAVKIPITLQADRIAVADATVTTPASNVAIWGDLTHLTAPDGSVHLLGKVDLGDVKRASGITLPLDLAGTPHTLDTNITAKIQGGKVQFENSHLQLGKTTVDLSGILNDPAGPDPVAFHSVIVLGEIGRLFRLPGAPQGTIVVNGSLGLRGRGYLIAGTAAGNNLSIQRGKTRITGIDVKTGFSAVPNRIDLKPLQLALLGGTFGGTAAIQNMRVFQIAGDVRHFDIARLAAAFTNSKPAFDGLISGPLQAEGSLKNATDLLAKANLSVTPVPGGLPISGVLNVAYNGRSDVLTFGPSHLQLLHSRIDLAGSLGRELRLHLLSRNLNDFRGLVTLPVTLNPGGSAVVDATVTGSLSAPRFAGRAVLNGFSVDRRSFSHFTAAFAASQTGLVFNNAVLTRGTLDMRFNAAIGLRNWKPLGTEPLRADIVVRNADLADALALVGQSGIPATGSLTAEAHLQGTIGSPRGTVDFTVLHGALEGAPFDSLAARATLTERAIDVPALLWIAGPSRIQAALTYQHALNDLSRGTLRARVASNQVQLAQFQSLMRSRPGLSGIVDANGEFTADIRPSPKGTVFDLTSVNGSVAARGLRMDGRNLGDLTATAQTAGPTVQYNVSSNLAGSTITVNGRTLLAGNHETTASAAIANLPLEPALALAGESDVPARGTLSATAQVSGTFADPRIQGAVTITKGSLWQEPFDRIQGHIVYTNRLLEASDLRVDKNGSYVELAGWFAHPPGDYADGQMRFHVRSNDIQLTKFQTLARVQPGWGGVIRISADGAATLRRNAPPLFSSLDADLQARALTLNGTKMGDATAEAETRGREIAFKVTSDLAGSKISGSGTMGLTADYPVNAQVGFSGLTYAGLRPLLGLPAEPVEANISGRASIAGPLTNTDALRGTLELTTLDAHSTLQAAPARSPRTNFELHNAGPIVLSLAHSLLTIQRARITGPSSDFTLTGSVRITAPPALDLHANGRFGLDVLQAFSPDVYSSGTVLVTAVIAGTTARPLVNGRLQLENASVNTVSLPVGISNAKGSIAFNGTEAAIQNITGESGGGKFIISGFVGYSGPEMRFRIQATATQVHFDYPSNVTTEASAKLTLAGTTSRSLLSGTVTVLDMAFHTRTDVGSLLALAAAPMPVPTVETGLLAGVHFDVKIQTAPDVQVRTSLAENLQIDGSVTLRGTWDHPGMLGRVAATEGEVIFFGARYNIDQGTVSFYNPQKINPQINLALETTVEGIQVTISVSGPMDRLKLSYRSDPPLPLNDLMALLGGGTAATTDPVLAARQPILPEQVLPQAGASTLLGQAVASPVSGRLERLFGVTRLRINPQIVTGSTTPQATLTVQQQLSREVTFTYIQDVSQTNAQIIRVEWNVDPRWSAVAQRDINGIFTLNFFYKKRFW